MTALEPRFPFTLMESLLSAIEPELVKPRITCGGNAEARTEIVSALIVRDPEDVILMGMAKPAVKLNASFEIVMLPPVVPATERSERLRRASAPGAPLWVKYES